MPTIRPVQLSDAPAIQAIYRPYVEQTVITFEETVPSVAEFEQRIQKIKKDFPYLVAEQDGQLLGYAYAGKFNARASYRWTAEITIYLAKEAQGKGLGRQLYQQMEDLLKQQGIITLMALITSPGSGSIEFHQRLGYQPVGLYPKVAYKFNQWHDLAILQKQLITPPLSPQEITGPVTPS